MFGFYGHKLGNFELKLPALISKFSYLCQQDANFAREGFAKIVEVFGRSAVVVRIWAAFIGGHVLRVCGDGLKWGLGLWPSEKCSGAWRQWAWDTRGNNSTA